MNIFLHEFKLNLRSVLVWSASIAVLLLAFMSIGSSFIEQSATLNAMMSSFPRELLIAFGMLDMDWSNPLGFLGLVFLFCQVCLGIQAANYGFGLVSIEETEWTADFLVAKPVSRVKIMTSKLLAALVSLLLTAIFVTIITFVSLLLFYADKDYQVKPVVFLMLSMPLLQLFFLSVGLCISLCVKRVRNVTPFSMALVFGLYILNAFGGMIGEKSLEILSPFEQWDPYFIIIHSAWDYPLYLISVAIIVITIPLSYLLYQRRNIPSAA